MSFGCLLDALASNYGQNKINSQKPQSHFKYFQQITMGATNRQHNQYTMRRIDCRYARNERNSAFPFNRLHDFRISIVDFDCRCCSFVLFSLIRDTHTYREHLVHMTLIASLRCNEDIFEKRIIPDWRWA